MLSDDWRLQALRSAKVVFLGPPWRGHATPPAYDAFVSLAGNQAALRELRPLLHEWVASGSGSAQLYAAVLLGTLDPREGRAALQALGDSSTSVKIHLGSDLPAETCTVGMVARALATGIGPLALRSVRA